MSDFDWHAENDPEAILEHVDALHRPDYEPTDGEGFYPEWDGPAHVADDAFESWRDGDGPGNNYPKGADDDVEWRLRKAFRAGWDDFVTKRRLNKYRLTAAYKGDELTAYFNGRLFAPRLLVTRPR